MITVYAQQNKTTKIGRVGENRRTRVAFPIREWLDEYPGASCNLVNRTPGEYESYPVATTETDGDYLYWTVLNSDLTKAGLGECELIIMHGSDIAKSIIYKTSVSESLDGAGDAPAPWESYHTEFLRIKDETVAASEAVQNMGVDSQTLEPSSQATVTKSVDPETGAVTLTFGVPKGDKGNPGTSIVSVVKTSSSGLTDTYAITMSDGSQSTFEVRNGAKGETGNGIAAITFNPNSSVTFSLTDGTVYTTDPLKGITYTPNVSVDGIISWTNDGGLPNPEAMSIKGPPGTPGDNMKIHICSRYEYNPTTRIPTIVNPSLTTFYLVPAEEASGSNMFVEWVYVSGNWEIFGSAGVDFSEYVKNTDYASSSNAGIVRIDSTKGIYLNSSNALATNAAATATIKGGSDPSRPIVPIYQHIATFYGLSKAAGVDMKDSYNAVGTYTDAAKLAIRNMVGAASSDQIPTKVSELQNDSGFVTMDELETILSQLN